MNDALVIVSQVVAGIFTLGVLVPYVERLERLGLSRREDCCMPPDSGRDHAQRIGTLSPRGQPRTIAQASLARAAGCAFAAVSSACTAAVALIMLMGGAVTGDMVGVAIGAAEAVVAVLLGRWAQRTWRR